MPLYTDQLGRIIDIKQSPQRIISVVPSQTELLYHLDLEEEVVGITKFCIHPSHWFRNKQRIGGTKKLDLEKIKALQPDLIIANKEENLQQEIETLANSFPIWISDINTLEEAISMIDAIGIFTNRYTQAQTLTQDIREAFDKLPQVSKPLKAAYLIWKDPYMTVGGDTFIHHMLSCAGFQNIFKNKSRYPEISIKEIQDRDCQVVLLSSEPYPFRQKHIDELQAVLHGVQIILVDGELFSWYGSRLLHSPAYFMQLQEQLKAIS